VLEGPGWHEESHPYSSLPLLVRPNSILPTGDRDSKADYEYPRGVTLLAFAIEDGARLSVAVPSQDGRPGSTFELRRDGAQVTVRPEASAEWRLLLVGETVESVRGGTIEAQAEGTLVVPASPDAVVEVTLGAAH
jgi:alpha-D-xyloside xylohydrolase